MALVWAKPLTKMSARNIPGGKGRPAHEADLTDICEPIVEKMWELRRLTTLCFFTISAIHASRFKQSNHVLRFETGK
jgi:hypothetical protein